MAWWNIMKNAEDKAYANYVADLTNSIASTKATGGGRPQSQNWGTFFAENTEASRPTDRRSRRAVDEDPRPVRGGWRRHRAEPQRYLNPTGVFGARRPDIQGQVPYQRWPSETQRGQGGGCSIPECSCGR